MFPPFASRCLRRRAGTLPSIIPLLPACPHQQDHPAQLHQHRQNSATHEPHHQPARGVFCGLKPKSDRQKATQQRHQKHRKTCHDDTLRKHLLRSSGRLRHHQNSAATPSPNQGPNTKSSFVSETKNPGLPKHPEVKERVPFTKKEALTGFRQASSSRPQRGWSSPTRCHTTSRL